MNVEIFKKLDAYFKKHHLSLYMVGGTSRDYLLNKELTDFDFATDASPSELKSLFKENKTPFIHLGSISVKFEGTKVDITCFRQESDYVDYRHPKTIKFIKSMEEDAKRRDFTINAIYIDVEGNCYDFYHGRDDLNNKIIRIIGDPDIRFNEDPLRILRAIRFAILLDFEIEEKTSESMKKNTYLLYKLTKEKVAVELKKAKKINKEKYERLLSYYQINENDFISIM